ncbi:Recombination protein RecR [bioreactor metagenome]|uniref:Recombination protein RecR n=1 Tax=bioreactor metagenome TaxID=1076179 RepID=A0A645CR07_9ZZZZ
MAEFPKVIKDVITSFERLPGIGPKGAARLAFYLMNTPKTYVKELAGCLIKMKDEIKICQTCFSVSEKEYCSICSDEKRNHFLICVVERAIDVMAIENMGGFKGVYHVLGGVINPLDHIGPDDLKIGELIERVRKIDGVEIEIILATNPTMEGEATALYIKKKLEDLKVRNLKITRIGSGLPMGADLEYADQATLSRALDGRRDI